MGSFLSLYISSVAINIWEGYNVHRWEAKVGCARWRSRARELPSNNGFSALIVHLFSSSSLYFFSSWVISFVGFINTHLMFLLFVFFWTSSLEPLLRTKRVSVRSSLSFFISSFVFLLSIDQW